MKKFKFFSKIQVILLSIFLLSTMVSACSSDKISGIQIEKEDNDKDDDSKKGD